MLCKTCTNLLVAFSVETKDIPIGVKYATLSYCWGIILEAHRIVLKKENLDAWKREIPNLKPMKTFHHAISISEKLGLDCIWIDSLCIIQDSRDGRGMGPTKHH